jgi:uracil-DNA glycosylase family 4
MSAQGEDAAAWRALNTELVGCRACTRLVAWREQVARQKRRAYRDQEYWGRPVPGFGDGAARLLIVGLAPGAHGSNRTGRMFTGDSSGDTLYAALHRAGFANQPVSRELGDGLQLHDVFITAIVCCAPPGNRPTPQEIATCRSFLLREWQLLTQVQVVLALGQIAFEHCQQLLRDQGWEVPRLRFRHGLCQRLDRQAPVGARYLVASYHPSRQNTQTGRLSQEMFDQVFVRARALLDGELS